MPAWSDEPFVVWSTDVSDGRLTEFLRDKDLLEPECEHDWYLTGCYRSWVTEGSQSGRWGWVWILESNVGEDLWTFLGRIVDRMPKEDARAFMRDLIRPYDGERAAFAESFVSLTDDYPFASRGTGPSGGLSAGSFEGWWADAAGLIPLALDPYEKHDPWDFSGYLGDRDDLQGRFAYWHDAYAGIGAIIARLMRVGLYREAHSLWRHHQHNATFDLVQLERFLESEGVFIPSAKDKLDRDEVRRWWRDFRPKLDAALDAQARPGPQQAE